MELDSYSLLLRKLAGIRVGLLELLDINRPFNIKTFIRIRLINQSENQWYGAPARTAQFASQSSRADEMSKYLHYSQSLSSP